MEKLFKRSFTPLGEIFKLAKNDIDKVIDEKYTVIGQIEQSRLQKNIIFIELDDGSCINSLQLVVTKEEVREKIRENLQRCTTIKAKGKIIKSPAKGQLIEMEVEECEILGKILDKEFIACGKNIPRDKIPHHLRTRFKLYRCIYRIRSKLMMCIHEYMEKTGILHIDPNILTKSDCEGAGETFGVTPLLKEKDIKSFPTKKDTTEIDFDKDFFHTSAYLTVSSQLQLEAMVRGLYSGVYTTNKSFRAEKSKTKRHVAEFEHIEWELMITELSQLMDFSEDFMVHCYKTILDQCMDELLYLEKTQDFSKGVIDKLKSFIGKRFIRISYDDALDLLSKHHTDLFLKFPEVKEIPKWGDDLGSYCERFISEEIYKHPVFVYNFPSSLKSFYMLQNDPYIINDSFRQTAQGCDLLIPGIGEVIGSSMRIHDPDQLSSMMKSKNLSLDSLSWYLQLRQSGTIQTGGAGAGFARIVSSCISGPDTSISIKEIIPFPVAYEELYY